MDNQDLERIVNYITAGLRVFGGNSPLPLTWFLNFGSLLKFTRGEDFVKDEDFDIGIFYDEYDQRQLENNLQTRGFEIKHKIVDDTTRKPLYYNLRMRAELGIKMEFCLFCWYKHKGLYWHTYDIQMEGRDIPKMYTFKGIPVDLFEDKIMKVNCPGTHRDVQILPRYGSVLDYWYPDWRIKRKQAVSTTRWQISMKSLKSFEDESYTIDTVKCPVFGTKWKWGKEV